jgi:hypothetical protein
MDEIIHNKVKLIKKGEKIVYHFFGLVLTEANRE